jgi:cytochrome d ubiquinol oxidase subunit II
VLVWRRRYEASRYTAALAVAAIVAGWALAQSPVLLKGLTVREAAASHDTLIAVIVAVLGGGVLLFPSLALLFRLTLAGRLDEGERATGEVGQARVLLAGLRTGLLARVAGACLIAGIGFTTIADAGWAHAIGVPFLFAFIVAAFVPALPPELVANASRGARGSSGLPAR